VRVFYQLVDNVKSIRQIDKEPTRMTKHRIIVNPISGRGTGERSVPLIEELLRGHGLDFDMVRTERPWHAAELAREAVEDGYDCVVAAGGDGTANEVVNGLMQAKAAGAENVSMGVICVGRGNDFAFSMGIPTEVAAGCQAVAQGRKRTIDVGRVVGGLYPEGRYFGNGVGVGFDAVVGFEALKLKRLHGFASYLVAALKTITLFPLGPVVHIEYDGESVTQRSLMVSIMNGTRLGGGFMMAPEGKSDDGLFDLCIAGQVSRLGILALIPRFMAGTQATHPAIATAHARQVRVTSMEGPLPAHADGETLCTEGQRLEIELLPGQIDLITELPGKAG
jgi:diacylglycerol kinase (ATP)